MANLRKKHSLNDIIEAIKDSSGIKIVIAERLKVHRNTVDNYLRIYKKARIAYQNEVDTIGDFAESVIVNNILIDKNIETAKWYARMKLKDRGYTEKQEIEHSGEQTINLILKKAKYENEENKDEDGDQ